MTNHYNIDLPKAHTRKLKARKSNIKILTICTIDRDLALDDHID